MSPELADLSLLELFSMELKAHSRALEEGLVGLEEDHGPSRLETLMRAAHSIKGAARIVGLSQAVGLAHAMEDVFLAAGKGGLAIRARHVDALLAATDRLARLAGADPKELPGLLAASAGELAGLEGSLRTLLAGPEPGDPGARAADVQPAPGEVASPKRDALGVASPHTDAEPGPSAPPLAPAPGEDAAAGPVQAPSGVTPAARSDVRLQAETLDRLMGLAGQCLVEAGALGRIFSQVRGARRHFLDLASLLSGLRGSLPPAEAPRLDEALALLAAMGDVHSGAARSLDALTRRMELVSDRLYAQVLGSRMRPFGDCAKGLPRLVRDLARDLGKRASFVLEGASTAVDRDILEALEAPLLHMAGNAVDHGLENPEERVRAGKPEAGTVRLSARHVSGHLEVRFADDGRGIDPEALRALIVGKGLAGERMAASLSREELFGFLFLPGFSTARAVTEVSGRGVGLDVAMTMVQRFGGAARVESEPGRGTAVVMRLPVSRSVVRALVFDVGGEPYALPLSRIGRVVAAGPGEILSVEGRQYLALDSGNVGLAPAAQILGLAPGPPPGEELPVVVLAGDQGLIGLAVDGFLGERDLVVHPLDPRLGKVPCVSCASILDDGSPVLVLDDTELARSIDALLAGGRLARVGTGQARGQARPKRVLVVDDSLTVREVERQLLAGRGYEVQTAVDGMEGLALARLGGFDLVVTDVDMPRMTGIELTRRLKADPALARTPVMIVSYKDRPEDRLAGLEAGADYYLAKSGFSDEALLTAVADLVGEP